MIEHKTLEQKTKEFWQLSTIWNGRAAEALTTGQALIQLKNIIQALGPRRRLSAQAGLLMSSIILGPRKRGRKRQRKAIPPTPIRNRIV